MTNEGLSLRLRDSLMPQYADACDAAIARIAPLCESPIEILLGAAIISSVYLEAPWIGQKHSDLILAVDAEHEQIPTSAVVLIAQYPWQGFRIDWALKNRRTGLFLFVECDGHDFHERTKEQAERDRRRDREITVAGIPILRFTGREIYRNPTACALQVLSAVGGLTQ